MRSRWFPLVSAAVENNSSPKFAAAAPKFSLGGVGRGYVSAISANFCYGIVFSDLSTPFFWANSPP
jgi:hypothetical protein